MLHHLLGAYYSIGNCSSATRIPGGHHYGVSSSIDPCSEGSFVSEKAAQALGLSRTYCHTQVTEVGGETTAPSSSSTLLSLKSNLDTSLCITFSALILPRLSALLPRQPVTLEGVDYL